ncbi:hypothetical protein SAMN05216249_10188 [Acetitomaculum ruminis DSM 5522]|uniref:Uncharacterized protein n=1 Tax=Acetitomaculum ruminis DSM 5522 TaxID=1120918 RepID=A0A1I0V0J9_9FIRM|nr:hypothetical protein [Acetitomaculum ruminis]SFA69801.1 hypothetical protein SAMN05216249_10188 [Acetitomaculum ruminis DSM 5522]
METVLYHIVTWISIIHDKINTLNDAYEYNFSDKQLHFLVIGILGMILIFLIHPLFLSLAKSKHIMAITWIYVFTLIIVVNFAIEIGQGITHTGTMDFEDIEFGLLGFVVFFAVFDVFRLAIHYIVRLINGNLGDD